MVEASSALHRLLKQMKARARKVRLYHPKLRCRKESQLLDTCLIKKTIANSVNRPSAASSISTQDSRFQRELEASNRERSYQFMPFGNKHMLLSLSAALRSASSSLLLMGAPRNKNMQTTLNASASDSTVASMTTSLVPI